MTTGVVRTLRFVAPEERDAGTVRYWRSRPPEERLQETLNLHREGNELFKGGNPPFAYVIELRDVSVA
ncbi:hypothetical protein RDV84_00475 [Lysobacter yananisis]|uniref:ASCH domain-containing protein n=1 Tax=Lysobacter yananisis TaxID=1003114 RepID=A0ABY9P8G0_9GAMM|nr:hypothetical protein [Lysobacter yananisis]WMT03365.1 hypothetical protein RDV84_00475 [Lysobacter yananisis]